ncbi:tyrosine-type recombinase/integrase [Ralstonia solanacearum]|uniref:Integrase n=2 Tax=Ralstonia solanacearum TaxID=305 RepID=A0A5H2PS20_RALSL|nr:tyrosine-type recombinase/integrase [Ralstonia solanacearum]AEG71871.1 site-specific tyrosine recombinase XerC [Ralstonia solanacearum Po82]AMP71738.1 integrase [Ralstonia solanacearum]AMP76325.1 integrase [Ralstonia solanacearum]AYB63148.1 integrase [Ralstonia solanacearum]EUJ12207.1 integrase [Ralstonia solanacearum P673]
MTHPVTTFGGPALPIEHLRVPPALSGAGGSNRARGATRQVTADDDLSAVAAWLARYAEVPGTVATYRKEAERLLLWSVLQHGKPLSSLTHEDLLLYERFLADPQPAWRWVMASRKKLGRASPEWRPFAGPLSPASAHHAMTILNALFAWLVDAGYLAGNPLSLTRRRGAKSAPRVTRYLSHELWEEVKETIEALPTHTERDRLHAARCRWLFTVLYLAGLRAAEIATTPMGAVFCRRDVVGADRWWIEVRGKGSKTRLVPATDELIAELARYRRAHGLPPSPQLGEARPLLLPLIGKEQPLSRGAVHLIVKEVFTLAAERLRARGPEWQAQADLLASASAHWIRHTAGSHMTDQQVDLRFVRDNLGHASLATTSVYLHAEDDARHQATQASHRIGWR